MIPPLVCGRAAPATRLSTLDIIASQKTPTPPSDIKMPSLQPPAARARARSQPARRAGPDFGPHNDVVRERMGRMAPRFRTGSRQPYVRSLACDASRGWVVSLCAESDARLLMGLSAPRNLTYGGKALARGADTVPWGRGGGQVCQTRRCRTDAEPATILSGMIASTVAENLDYYSRANSCKYIGTFLTSFSTIWWRPRALITNFHPAD